MTRTGADPHLDLLDEARLRAAAEDRQQRRLLADADRQDATFRGSVEQLAESDAELVVHTTVGRRLRGVVAALSGDHVQLRGDHGAAWVRLDAVTVVRTGERSTGASGGASGMGGGERAARPSVSLSADLSHLVDDRATVEVLFDGGGGIRGTAAAAGIDVLTVVDGHGATALVHLDRVAVVLAHA